MSASMTPAARALDWRMESMGWGGGGRKETQKGDWRWPRKREEEEEAVVVCDGFVTVGGQWWREAAWEREGER